MCVYRTYVLSTHTTYAAQKAAGACVFLSPGWRERGNVPRRGIALPGLPAGIFALRSAGTGLLLGRTRLVRGSVSRVWDGAAGCTGLPVLLCGSFITLCVLINRADLLPAGINWGWIWRGEAPWGWEGAGATGHHGCAPGADKTPRHSPWGLCYSRFWAKITRRRGFWVPLSLV